MKNIRNIEKCHDAPLTVHTYYSKDNVYSQPCDKTDLFCPGCGTQAVYVAQGDGDYYAGPEYYCVGCGGQFTFQGISHGGTLGFDWT